MRYVLGGVAGLFLGFFLLHPFSMFLMGMTNPAVRAGFVHFRHAFNLVHLPMAFFFGILGGLVGLVVLSLTDLLARERERVKKLEGILAICSYCYKVRDDKTGKSEGINWEKIDQFITEHTDADFTHGICPDCYAKVMEEVKQLAKD